LDPHSCSSAFLSAPVVVVVVVVVVVSLVSTSPDYDLNAICSIIAVCLSLCLSVSLSLSLSVLYILVSLAWKIIIHIARAVYKSDKEKRTTYHSEKIKDISKYSWTKIIFDVTTYTGTVGRR
jgi:hypothetical protein